MSAKTLGGLAGPDVDAEGLPTIGPAAWISHLPARPTAIVAAFSVGITLALTFYALNGGQRAGNRQSVMIDRDLTSVRARTPRRPAGPEAEGSTVRIAEVRTPAREPDAPVTTPVAATASTQPVAPVTVPIATTASTQPVAPVTVPIATTASTQPVARSAPKERVASAAKHVPVAYDRVLGLADALDGCARESFFARLACEQHARTRYCEGAGGRIPECAGPPPREYGQ
jgi:hypothetical protein